MQVEREIDSFPVSPAPSSPGNVHEGLGLSNNNISKCKTLLVRYTPPVT